jgi:hypothetical protein
MAGNIPCKNTRASPEILTAADGHLERGKKIEKNTGKIQAYSPGFESNYACDTRKTHTS